MSENLSSLGKLVFSMSSWKLLGKYGKIIPLFNFDILVGISPCWTAFLNLSFKSLLR